MHLSEKKWNKPLACALALAAIAGGLTPVLASSDKEEKKAAADTQADTQAEQEHKIVLDPDQGADETGYTRYNLRELLADEARFQQLLSSRADDLYLVIDELDFAIKLTSAIERYADDWEALFAEYEGDIYVEVRPDAAAGFVKLEQERQDDVIYITGKVTEAVDKVVIIQPSGGKIEIGNFPNREFRVSIPAFASTDDAYVRLEAYADGERVETEILNVNKADQVTDDLIIYTLGLIDQAEQKVRVNGIVAAAADQVYVRYGDETKQAKLNKAWEGVLSFSATFAADPAKRVDEALVTVYRNNKKVDEQRVDLLAVHQPGDDDRDEQLDDSYKIDGKAVISPRYKRVHVKGKITGEAKELAELAGEWRLVATAPDGVRHVIALADDLSFAASLPFQNRSYSAKAVHLELYKGSTLVAEADIAHGTPVNKPNPGDAGHDQENAKDTKKDKANEKDKQKKGKYNERDVDERDDDDEDRDGDDRDHDERGDDDGRDDDD